MSSFLPIEAALHKDGFVFVAGLDEAGRGPLAGPVVSAVVILKPDAKLKGLNDSKLLTPSQREALFPQILANCLDYAISIIPHSTIDKYNILHATRLANLNCLTHLKRIPDITLIDGHDKQLFDFPHQTIIKGDSKVKSIAAASVLAKVTRDHIMRHYAKEFPAYAFEEHMGYGTRLHRDLIKKHGPCEIHRKSFILRRAEQLNLI